MGILNTLGGLVIFVIILGVIIAVHEGGHFLFARRAGILAREFAIGMGPILWKKKKGETLYTIRAIPIGGFCAIAGEEVEDDPFKTHPRVKLDVRDGVIHNFYLDVDNENIDLPIYDIMEYDLYDQDNTGNLYMEVIREGSRYHFKVKEDAVVYLQKMEYQIAPYNRTIGSKSKRARAMVMFGGPLMNFLLAILVFLFVGLIQGFPNYASSEVNISEKTVAYEAGLRSGDIIKELETIDGKITQDVDEWNDISVFMREYRNNGNPSVIKVTVSRNNQEMVFDVLPTITFNNLALETQVTDSGLKVINYTEAKDSMIDNAALKNYYTDDKGNKKNLIITSFKYDGEVIPATDLKQVFEMFNSYTGDRKLAEANQIEVNFISNGETGSVKVTPYNKKIMDYQLKNNGLELIKVALWVNPVYKFHLGKSLGYSITQTISSGTAVFSTLGMLFRGDITLKALSGFVGIASATVKIAQHGLVSILYWTGLLSVNIGLLNLLPIPALDGGRLVFLGYEAITKKKPSPKIETWLITATMLLLFALMIYVTINDFIRVF